MSLEQREALKIAVHIASQHGLTVKQGLQVQAARNFHVAGFKAFFELVMRKPLLKHWENALKEVFNAQAEGMGTVIEAFRGSAKTTTFHIGLGAWLVGMFPTKPGLIVQAGDENASKNAQKIAYIIEHDPMWKVIFPHIVPDKEKGWGANGYEVKKTHTDFSLMEELDYGKWQAEIADKIDPSFVGLGYKSSALIGKRPYWLIVDDIHDEKNTASDRRLLEVKTILKGTIFPAANMAQWIIFIGTPWLESDALHYCVQTGEFHHIKIPVQGKDGAYTWPEMFGEKACEKEKNKAGDIEYARMFLLDLEKTKGLVLKREWLEPSFPYEDIRKEWPAIMFLDYTSTKDPTSERSDYFSLCVGQLVPDSRTIVLSDGVYARLTHLDAQRATVAKVLEYPNVLIVGVEAIFAGNEYGQVLQQNQELVDVGIIPELCRGGPWQKQKGYRFEYLLADAFRKNIMRLSDKENEFLNAFKKEWIGWQGDALADMGHDDALDAGFGVLHLGMDYLVFGKAYKERAYSMQHPIYEKEKQKNPFSQLGR